MKDVFTRIKIGIERSIWTLLFLLTVLILILLYINENIKLETFGLALGGGITAYLGILKQTIESDKVFRELFIAFNSRYSDQTNDLLNKLRIESNYNLNINEKLIIIDYFNLCSEEYLWYLKGRIPSKVWEAWLAGIIVNLKIPKVKELFENETRTKIQKNSFYGFADYIIPKL